MSEERGQVLVIEDDASIRRFLRVGLTAQGYAVSEAGDARAGLAAAAAAPPEVVILDLGLPDLDGLEVVRSLREWTKVPVIVLSARGQERDKVLALDAGADDYLTKPFGLPELSARIRVALRHARRAEGSGEVVFTAGTLAVDLSRREVTLDGGRVHLTPTEYKLLAVLVRHAGKVVTHRQLLQEVWGLHSLENTHYLRVYMQQLRHKLEADPAHPRHLLTEPVVGYRLSDE